MRNALILLLIILASCLKRPGEKSGDVLARVMDDYLYASELSGIVPQGTSIRDSLMIIQSYVNNWIRQQLLLHKAQNNLLPEDRDFEKKIEEYRNSLIIFQYESKLVNQNLDTIVKEQEIASYYENNLENFRLKYNIVKLIWGVFPSNDSRNRKIRGFLNSPSRESLDSLESCFMKYAKTSFLQYDKWMPLEEVMRTIPVNTHNPAEYVRYHTNIEIDDGAEKFFIRILDFRTTEDYSPLELEREHIRQIILNQRKMALLAAMREELYNTALENNQFEIYSP